jgi:UDPglucose 6-dehydrogenase
VNKEDKIAVIGIGRLGICLALNLERVGYNVFGIDTSFELVTQINSKKFRSNEPEVNELLAASKHFFASTQLAELFHQNITTIFLVLPTPSLPNGSFSHQYIEQVADSLSKFGVQKNKICLVVNSTTMPGYCDTLQNKLKKYNYEVLYNPEFIAQGTIIRDQQVPDQILIGEESTAAGDLLVKIYSKLCVNKPVFCRMSRKSAEITKLATNCFLTTKIAFANAIGDIATSFGAEPEKILKAIGTDSRIGEKYFKYGFGFGGPCFPRDNAAFRYFSENNNYEMTISKATEDANTKHADFILQTFLSNKKPDEIIVFNSVTYKVGTDILEESQQLKLAIDLVNCGRKVQINESKTVLQELSKRFPNKFILVEND